MDKQKKLTFIIGTGETKDGKRIPELDKKIEAAQTRLASLFGGYTRFDTFGGWIGPQGTLISEPSIVFVVYSGIDKNWGLIEARDLAILFDQTTVLYTVEEVQDFQLVSQN